MENDLKEEVIRVLHPIFGDSVKKTIQEFYDDSDSKELLLMAREMLEGYMGEEQAKKIIANITNIAKSKKN